MVVLARRPDEIIKGMSVDGENNRTKDWSLGQNNCKRSRKRQGTSKRRLRNIVEWDNMKVMKVMSWKPNSESVYKSKEWWPQASATLRLYMHVIHIYIYTYLYKAPRIKMSHVGKSNIQTGSKVISMSREVAQRLVSKNTSEGWWVDDIIWWHEISIWGF